MIKFDDPFAFDHMMAKANVLTSTKEACYPLPFRLTTVVEVLKNTSHNIKGRTVGLRPLIILTTISGGTRFFDATKMVPPFAGEDINSYLKRVDNFLEDKSSKNEMIL